MHQYFICMKEEETINHILLHFARAQELWSLVFSLLGAKWVMP